MEDNGAQVNEVGTEIRSGSCRRRLLSLGWVLLHLGCVGYSLYLIWLLAYLKDNPYYWFLSLIPFFFNLLSPMTIITIKILDKENFDNDDDTSSMLLNKALHAPSVGVVLTLMTCFTMLTRIAYYHRQPDEFIGPRFIILSLQGSIVLIFLNFCLQREGKLEKLLNFKDALTRMLLDFVDIFNMVEILSANVCVGVGSFVSENSSTEISIQAFCTMSFVIVWNALSFSFFYFLDDDLDDSDYSEQRGGENWYMFVLNASFICQNLPFLVIRIVVWAQYELYSLGFLMKNFIAIVLYIASVRRQETIQEDRTASSEAQPSRLN
ncbi:hypothetical protein ACROYT_G017939 [Oculina patagonica]